MKSSEMLKVGKLTLKLISGAKLIFCTEMLSIGNLSENKKLLHLQNRSTFVSIKKCKYGWYIHVWWKFEEFLLKKPIIYLEKNGF